MRLQCSRACCCDGCTEAIILAHGFTTDFLVDLIRAGLATAQTERAVAGGRGMAQRGSTKKEIVEAASGWPVAFAAIADKTSQGTQTEPASRPSSCGKGGGEMR
jgi:hypothetical protein